MIVAGFGFRSASTEASLRDALARASRGHVVERLAAPADKSGAACLQSLARTLALPVDPIPAAVLRGVTTATSSLRVEAARGTGSVAEAAALAAAGPGARLVATRVISEDRTATCALAEGAAA